MKLTFVYNAKSGKLNALLDSAHKVLRPDTYACDLCALTHGVFGEKAVWKDFRQKSGVECVFLHRDEVKAELVAGIELPVVLAGERDTCVIASAEQLRQFENVEQLIRFLEKVVKVDSAS